MRHVLVTGGAGFLGSHLVQELLRRGYRVRILDNLSRGNLDNLSACLSEVELIHGDVTNVEQVRQALIGVEQVFHLAAINGTRYFYTYPDKVLDFGARSILAMLDALMSHPVRTIVYASSSEVYGIPETFPTSEEHPLMLPDPTNPRWSYSTGKILGEMMLLHKAPVLGITPIILRYHNCYGPRMGWQHVISEFIYRMLTREPFTIQGAGTETRSFCYVSDAVQATLAAAEADLQTTGIFNVGNPVETSINSLLALLENIVGFHVERKYVAFPLKGTSRRLPSIEKARRLLGYNPEIDLEEGLKRTYEWCLQDIDKVRDFEPIRGIV